MNLDAPDPHALLEAIARLQSTGADGYGEGLFPTQRAHRYASSPVEDDTVFPTAVTVYTLQRVREALSESSRLIVDEITRKAVATYPKYLNNEGYPMYNFWPNMPDERFFPNNAFLQRFRIFHLPEDIDTTAYIYLTQAHPRRDVLWFKERLLRDTNGNRRRIRHTRPAYRHLRAYSTWLGDANMPIDFDVCALANLLLFVFSHGLPLNEHDHASLAYITTVLDEGDHLHHPFDVAPWYGNTTIILYHVARLTASFEIPELTARRDKVVGDLHTQAKKTEAFMERVLLSTSLMRLGYPPLGLRYPDDWAVALDAFHFFTVSLLTAIDNPITWILARLPLFQIRYRCQAASLAWLVEHEVYRRTLDA